MWPYNTCWRYVNIYFTIITRVCQDFCIGIRYKKKEHTLAYIVSLNVYEIFLCLYRLYKLLFMSNSMVKNYPTFFISKNNLLVIRLSRYSSVWYLLNEVYHCQSCEGTMHRSSSFYRFFFFFFVEIVLRIILQAK